jgi:hypothetical protein
MDVETDALVGLVADAQGRQGNRRTRLDKGLPAEMKEWLTRASRIHAHICYIVRLFGNPSKAGGTSNAGETFEARAARGDRTLLFDCLRFCGDEIELLRDEVQARMDAAPPTSAPPGSAEKVAVMLARAENGESIFIEGDAGISLE